MVESHLLLPSVFCLFSGGREFKEQEWPTFCGMPIVLSSSLLGIIKCGRLLYMGLADSARADSWLYGFYILDGSLLRSVAADNPGFNYLKYVHTLLSVCSLSHTGFQCYRSSLHNLPRANTGDPLWVDSVICSRLWSPSIRVGSHLPSTSKDSWLLPWSWKPAPPTPWLPASLLRYSSACTRHHYSSLMSAQAVKGAANAC